MSDRELMFSLLVVGEIDFEDLIPIAIEELGVGNTSTSTQIFAGLNKMDSREDYSQYFQGMIQENGWIVPNKVQATQNVILYVCRQIESGGMPILEGFRKVRDLPRDPGLETFNLEQSDFGVGSLNALIYQLEDDVETVFVFDPKREEKLAQIWKSYEPEMRTEIAKYLRARI